MSMTISNTTGDGVNDTLIQASIELPDSGQSVNVTGRVAPIGGQPVEFTGSPVTIPAPPGSGSIYYIIEANTTTGALAVVQSTSAMPPADAGSVVLFQQTLVPANTDPALDAATVTPDTY